MNEDIPGLLSSTLPEDSKCTQEASNAQKVDVGPDICLTPAYISPSSRMEDPVRHLAHVSQMPQTQGHINKK